MAKKKEDLVDPKKDDDMVGVNKTTTDSTVNDNAAITSDNNIQNKSGSDMDIDTDSTGASSDSSNANNAQDDTDKSNQTADDKLPGATAGIADTKTIPVKEPHHVSFFRQYVDQMKANNPKAAIKAANNAIKSMLATNDAAAFDDILSGFIESRMILTQKVRLQAASILPMNERAVLEIISTIYHALVSDPKMPLNLEYARSVIKNDAFITWVARKLAK